MTSLARPLSGLQQSDAILAEIVEEVTNQFHAGEPVDIERYVKAHPELADQLRQLVPALQVLADLGHSVVSRNKIAVLPGDVRSTELGELGDFRLLREVGRGGMGVVYEAEQISLNRRVALKVLPFAAALDPKQLQRFKNEAQAAAHLQHTNIVPVHYVGCERGVHFYAMQYIDGHTLAKVIADLRRRTARAANGKNRRDELKRILTTQDGPSLPPSAMDNAQSAITPTPQAAAISTEVSTRSRAFFRAVAQLGVEAAEALEHAHQLGVIHRDIKPGNLLIDAGRRLWVTDFGLAHCRSQPGLTMTGDLLGTLRYMSPEQALAKRVVVDARTDVYSLGVTLYELLTLEPAYNGGNREEVLRQIAFEEPYPLHRLNDAIPPELDTITLKAMAKNSEERYGTAQELADDLRRFLEDKPIKAKRPSLWQRTAKWARRHSTVVRAAVVMLVLAVVGLALSTALIWQSLERERQTSYFQRIALAEREGSANSLSRVEQLLDECPPDLRGWEWHYLKRLPYKALPTLRHDSIVLRVAFSPAGQYFASGTIDGKIKLWDAHTGQLLRSIPAHKDRIFSLAFSPDGEQLASGSVDSYLTIWKLCTGEKLLSWIPHGGDVSNLAFSADGRVLASGGGIRRTGESHNSVVKIWDAASGQMLRELLHEGPFLALSRDGRRLAACGEDCTGGVNIWDTATGKKLLSQDVLSFPVTSISSVALSPDGRFVAAANGDWWTRADGEIRVWDARTGKLCHRLRGHTGFIVTIAFSPDGRRLASAGMDKTIKLWDVASGREALTLRGRHTDFIQSLAFSPDGHKLISASEDQTVQVWDATPLSEQAPQDPLTLQGHRAGVFSVAFNPDAERLATASADGTVKIWDLNTHEVQYSFPAHGKTFHSVAFSPNGTKLAAAGDPGELRVWDTADGKELVSEPGLIHVMFGVVFSPDGRFFISAGGDQSLRIWNSSTGALVHETPRAHDYVIVSLAISPDGRYIATAAVDEKVKIWDATTGQPVVTLPPDHHGRPTSVAFRPDGQVLASASADGTIRLWDTRTWQQKQPVRDSTAGVESLAFSPDGQLLAWGSTDGTVKIWQAATEEIRTLRGHTSWVECVAFSPDGQRIASGSLDGTVKLWPWPTVPDPEGLK